ncbi:TetR/AcrR family transcriptional regulator [Mycobacterium malmoense]|uniref:TetR family transcriptional regulator n=1 Tax=Mycobacterium malmoense TaxID=1780 RepID=A0ABX3SR27_MYCMA|nr:TetR/AcrR family transcriptional regulator [Mycobacterium malmoense]ORA80193.1 TetR family transcriptional regulator [Mycobacterium malmoense]QZA16049.1 TetR/AcrR family transcriptional regulator [Mycobacterium malmoense]UNB92860.1 TetR/AcrR family transcriptional regulator [Mycobacterium malmoense]
MPRIVKHPDIRRAELLDRAAALFLRHGFDNVSLNDIIADAGISKGAFYHWFPSKDALIAALAERSARETFAGVEDAVAARRGDALARLNALLQAGFDVNVKMGGPEQLAAMVSLLRPDNAQLYGRILAVEEALFRPLLTRLISEGVAAGVFDTFDPEGVADMIYGLAARTNSNILDVLQAADESGRQRAIDCLITRFRLHGLAVDRILGLPDGSVATPTRAQVEAMVMALPRNY